MTKPKNLIILVVVKALIMDRMTVNLERSIDMLTNNKNVLNWVEEMVALTKPDKVTHRKPKDSRGRFVRPG